MNRNVVKMLSETQDVATMPEEERKENGQPAMT